MTISVQSRNRLFPESYGPSTQPKIEALSILDNTVLNYATSGCIWFYDKTLNVNRLVLSLRSTLDAYPQWAGQLHFADYDPSAGHTHRQGRMMLSYDSPADPGIEYIVAHADFPMCSMIPTDSTKQWDATKIDYNSLLDNKTSFAPGENKTLPAMKIQITTFTDTSTAIAIALAHPLADAQALLIFAKDWAATNLALSSSKAPPKLNPLFNPSLLSAAAAGNINGTHPDPAILETAAKLPSHRFDYWASGGPTCPDYAKPLIAIPPELKHLTEAQLQKGMPIPWHEWDLVAPVSHTTFFFSAVETHAIYLHATGQTETRISHQDALLGHLWAALIRARVLKDGEPYFMDVTIDARRRVSPPLPPSFIGSPIINVGVPGTASTSAEDIGTKASAIRKTVATFTPDAVAALLHEMAFELGAQRRWNCFLGKGHVIVTSWVGIGIGEVCFEKGVEPVWEQALMPFCDGCVLVREGRRGGNGGEEWWAKGVSLDVWLRSDVMGRLVEDEGLRASA